MKIPMFGEAMIALPVTVYGLVSTTAMPMYDAAMMVLPLAVRAGRPPQLP